MSEFHNPSWTPLDLLHHLQQDTPLFVLDVRNRDEFSRFRLEGRTPLPALNLPYFEMLELGGEDDMLDSLTAYLRRELPTQLPRDTQILTVCAKGDTSAFTADALRRLDFTPVNLSGGMKAWAELYTTTPIIESTDLSIYQIARPARGCLSYLATSHGEAIILDPLRHTAPYIELATAHQLRIIAVVDTHAHADHISGGPPLAAHFGAPYYLHPYDAIHPADLLPARIPYEPLRDGAQLSFGNQHLHALHIPGHTLGLTALLLDDRYLFCGDSLFLHSIARPDLGGNAAAWAPLHTRSLRRLLALPDSITILPGHFSSLAETHAGLCSASLRALKHHNPGLLALQQGTDGDFVQYLLDNLPAPNEDYIDIKRVNAGLKTPSEEDAWSLELGKNVCGLAASAANTGGS